MPKTLTYTQSITLIKIVIICHKIVKNVYFSQEKCFLVFIFHTGPKCANTKRKNSCLITKVHTLQREALFSLQTIIKERSNEKRVVSPRVRWSPQPNNYVLRSKIVTGSPRIDTQSDKHTKQNYDDTIVALASSCFSLI